MHGVGNPVLLAPMLALMLAMTAGARPASQIGASSGQASDEAPLLKLGRPVSEDLKGGEAHPYRLKSNAGQYVEIAVRQRNIDVIVSVFDAAGKSLGEFDSPTGLNGTEQVRFVADAAGEYRIVARALKTEAYGGSYEVKMERIRKATAQDKRIVAAIKARMLGDELRAKDETRRQSLEQYARALELWRAARERAGTGSTLRAIGFAYVRLGDDDKAYDHFDRALAIWREIGDRRSEAYTYLIFATIHTRRGDHQRALDERMRALPLWRADGDVIEETTTLTVIGLSHSRLNQKEKAIERYEQALALSRRSGNRALQADVLRRFGALHESFGETQPAIEFYRQSLELWRAMGRRSQEADVRDKIEKLRRN